MMFPVGYVCVWGTTPKHRVVDSLGVDMPCPRCRKQSRMIGKSVARYFSVFYIPLFPEGKAEEYFECTACGGQFQGSIGDLRFRMDRAKQELDEKAAEATRRVRDHPEDADGACEALGALMSADRHSEALALGEKLVAVNPTHGNLNTIMGRLLFAEGRSADALAAFERVIQASPQHAAAHFFKALALAQDYPRDRATALAEAKLAKDLGYPDAPDLVRAIETDTGRRV